MRKNNNQIFLLSKECFWYAGRGVWLVTYACSIFVFGFVYYMNLQSWHRDVVLLHNPKLSAYGWYAASRSWWGDWTIKTRACECIHDSGSKNIVWGYDSSKYEGFEVLCMFKIQYLCFLPSVTFCLYLNGFCFLGLICLNLFISFVSSMYWLERFSLLNKTCTVTYTWIEYFFKDLAIKVTNFDNL